jgi:hypothetical protein
VTAVRQKIDLPARARVAGARGRQSAREHPGRVIAIAAGDATIRARRRRARA